MARVSAWSRVISAVKIMNTNGETKTSRPRSGRVARRPPRAAAGGARAWRAATALTCCSSSCTQRSELLTSTSVQHHRRAEEHPGHGRRVAHVEVAEALLVEPDRVEQQPALRLAERVLRPDVGVAGDVRLGEVWNVQISPVTSVKKITARSRAASRASSAAARWRRRSAASYSVRGTSSRPARKMIIASPAPHSESSTSAGFDHDGSKNHSGPPMPTCASAPLTGPRSGFSR